jgi:ribosome-binding protein aMBF1 (putative translation factor)
MEYLRSMSSEEDYVEAIKDGEIVRIPESVAIEEDLFVLRKVIKAEEEVIPDLNKEPVRSSSKLDTWKNAGILARQGRKNNVIQDLRDNFHWHVSRNRRAKNLNRKELADEIGATEEEVKMIEMGELPKDDFVLINKIENVLKVNLRKEKSARETVTLADLQRMSENKIKEEIEKSSNIGTTRQITGETKLSGDEIELIDFDN